MARNPVPEEFLGNGHGSPRSGERDAPRTINAADLMALELPPIKWVVPGILPEGLTILAGKPKLGKSWLAAGIGVAVASGGTALGKRHVERGEVLYLALEDNQRRLQKRLGKLLNGEDAPVGLHISTRWRAVDDGGAEDLENWLSEHPDARLIVVDVLKRVRPQPVRQQSAYDADYEAGQALQDIAARYGVAIVAVHHTRKEGSLDPLEEVSGTFGLTAGVDNTLVLKRERGRGDAYLHVDGRDIEEPAELALTWDADLCSWTLAGDAEEFRISRERAEVLRALEEAPEPIGPKGLAEALDKKSGAMRQMLSQMSQQGLIKSVNYGRYTIADTADSADTSDTYAEYGEQSVSGEANDADTSAGPAESGVSGRPTGTDTSTDKSPANGQGVSGVSTVSGGGGGGVTDANPDERQTTIEDALADQETDEPEDGWEYF